MKVVLLGLIAAISASPADPSHEGLLARIRRQMAENLAHLPNYTCRETIERAVQTSSRAKLQTQDLLRLDVAYLEGREMFAWPGSPRFGEQTIHDLIPRGTVSTGSFGLLAKTIFATDAPIFTFQDQNSGSQGSQVQFGFHVEREKSPLVLQSDNRRALVGYRGFFTANAGTLDVNLFQVDAEDIPPAVEIREGQERVAYERSRIGDSDYLLPKMTDALLVNLDGRINRNHITLDRCREFVGESTVRFADADALPTAAGEAKLQKLPSGIELEMRLTTPIERGVTAIGDVASAELTKEVRGALPLPRGAKVSLRVIGMETVNRRVPFHVVRFQLLSIEAAGIQYQAAGVLDRVNNFGSTSSARDGRVSFTGAGAEFRLKPGLLMIWRTTQD